MQVPTSLTDHGFVRVAACSPAVSVGDVAANVKATTTAARALAKSGAQLIVFPELGLTGYSCADLFMNAAFRDAALRGLLTLAEQTKTLSAVLVVGGPLEVDDRLYNVAAVLQRGQVLGLVPKTHLPNTWEFYERRWFASASTLRRQWIELGESTSPISADLIFEDLTQPHCKLAIELCEDLWTVEPPSGKAALRGATIIANLSASNELLGKAAYRQQLVAQQSARTHTAYVYAAASAGESSTDIVFSGHCLIAENGAMLAESERFAFDTRSIIADIDVQRLHHERLHSTAFQTSQPPESRLDMQTMELGEGVNVKRAQDLHRPLRALPFVPDAGANRDAVCSEIIAIQATGLARRLRAVQPKTLVLGLSGGLDSTLALLVAQEAIRRSGVKHTKLLTLTMPGMGTTKRTKDNAVDLAKALGAELRTISIKRAVEGHLADIGHSGAPDIAFENAQARERTQVLMDVANQTGGLVLGTGDLSEAALGWCTFNGDHMSMYHVNAGVPKTLVRYLIAWCATQPSFAKAAPILQDILDTPISPELLPADSKGKIAQKTEDSVGPYELVDFFLYHLIRLGFGASKIAFLARLAFEGRHRAAEIDQWLERFLHRFTTQQFKRSSMPDGPKVGTVALSPRGDWRMPSDVSAAWWRL
jgi:NAD+ synthase (glutamine-hydrolysing)